IKKQKASFGLDLERRSIDENAFILATTLDDRFNPQQVNQAVVAPNIRTSISPRLDYSINAANTLVLRYEHTRMSRENEGIGDFSLASRGYDQRNTENVLQLTETAVLSPQAINETRFQYLRTHLSRIGDYSIPALTVQGAFEGGGAQIGNSGAINSRWELANSTTLTSGKHTVKWGGTAAPDFHR
ncbi:MAG: TonB-dependent receptor, partial [Bryobacteraceae bacterium]|nr:TonB-dependent receptor [Bryobacteraceae bacterium]